jgi:cell wall-associated NlpC family hydrolase
MALRESEDAARLLERLLSDRTLRERFRRDPAGVSREAGLERVAEELRARDGKALDTLDGRESRSSLAGVLMAAALEGVGIYDFSHHVAAHADSVPEPVGQVLARHRDHAAGAAGLPAAHAAALPEPLDAARAAPASPPSAAGEFRAITPHEAAAAAADRSAPEVPADAEDAPDDGGGEQGEGEEDSEAGAPRAEDEEEDENEDEEDEVGEAPDADDASSGDQDDAGDNPDGDHDDNSDASDGGGGDDAPDGGDGGDGADGADAPDGGDGGDAPDGGDGGDAPDAGDDGGDGHAGGAIDIAPGTATYPGDDAPQGQIAAWMAREARSRGLPAELPVMAALVESDMRNLVDGDRDSVGFFQMRHGIWNQGKYAGYPQRPQLQLEWFMDHAVAVKAQRIAAGKPVDDPQSYGEWIADVERPAAEYRGRYQLRLGDARNLLDQASGRSRGPVRDGPAGVEQIADGATAGAGPRAMAALVEARKHMGTPYRWGGSTPQTGFDCSGLVQWAYAKAGIRIPRTSEQQILAGNATAVDRSHLRPGDLVFFRNASGDVHHVGMSLGGDRFINAPHTGARVRINNLKEPYFAREFAGGRRFDTSTPRPDAVDRAPASGPRADGPDIDPDEVRRAETALARDAAEAQQPGTLLFEAVRAQEMRKTNDAGFWPAIDSTSPD